MTTRPFFWPLTPQASLEPLPAPITRNTAGPETPPPLLRGQVSSTLVSWYRRRGFPAPPTPQTSLDSLPAPPTPHTAGPETRILDSAAKPPHHLSPGTGGGGSQPRSRIKRPTIPSRSAHPTNRGAGDPASCTPRPSHLTTCLQAQEAGVPSPAHASNVPRSLTTVGTDKPAPAFMSGVSSAVGRTLSLKTILLFTVKCGPQVEITPYPLSHVTW